MARKIGHWIVNSNEGRAVLGDAELMEIAQLTSSRRYFLEYFIVLVQLLTRSVMVPI